MNSQEWASTPLSRITSKIGSGATPRGGKDAYKDEGIALIRSLNVYDFQFYRQDLAFIDEVQADQLTNVVVRANDILLNITGASVARCCMVPASVLPARVNQHVAIVRVDEKKAHGKFVYYCINSPRYKNHLLTLAQGGATREALTKQTIEEFEISLPDLPTQHRIASILSAYDDLIENNARRIAILEEMARRIYEEWFVRFRFPGHENVRMVESELGLVPEGWEQTSLGKVAENHDRYRKPLSKMQRESFKGPYPYYGAAKVFDYVREYLFDGQFLLLAEDGSVETQDGFPVLQLTDGKFWANNHTHILRGSDLASTEYLYLRLEKQPIRGYITGAAQPKLTQANMNRIPISLPPGEQMEQFTAMVKPFFELRAILGRKNSNLRITRDILLPKLISGELDVSNLSDPESAAA